MLIFTIMHIVFCLQYFSFTTTHIKELDPTTKQITPHSLMSIRYVNSLYEK